jgi:transposase
MERLNRQDAEDAEKRRREEGELERFALFAALVYAGGSRQGGLPMAYSNDYRLKVLAAVDRGESQASVARRYEIGERTVRRYLERRAETGDVSAYKTGPKEPVKLTPADDALMREQVRLRPGVTAKELVAMLDGKVVISTVCRRLIALDLPLKKSR